MKFCIQEDTEEIVPVTGIKLGIVRLGRIAGKVKYALLDEPDIQLVGRYGFEPRMEIDPNGNGVAVYAWAYDVTKGKASGMFIHELLWEIHRGGIPHGYKVFHRNQITVDNRLDNLTLVPKSAYSFFQHCLMELREQSLYWVAIQQLPPDPSDETTYGDFVVSQNFTKDCYHKYGNYESYYECHYPPCTSMEQEPRQFSICGRCQEARYCGILCQQKHWAVHKKNCKERSRPVFYERTPDR